MGAYYVIAPTVTNDTHSGGATNEQASCWHIRFTTTPQTLTCSDVRGSDTAQFSAYLVPGVCYVFSSMFYMHYEKYTTSAVDA